MTIVKEEIGADAYERYMTMTKAEQMAEIEPTLPRAFTCGYGYYGFYLSENDNRYFICHRIGDSCD